jgi:hypothetical protein
MGINTNDTLKYQGISSVLALVAQMVCIVCIDKVGRRWAMIGGNLANCLFFTIATIMLAVFPPGSTSNASASWGSSLLLGCTTSVSAQRTDRFLVSSIEQTERDVIRRIRTFNTDKISGIVPAEVFDTKTRSKGVSIGVMVSFAFNTMIGQVTPIAMESIGWRFYLLFVVCNFTNALYFWAFQPETKRRPLEEMNYLFTNAP